LRNLLPANERLTHVVVMGMGEPMANLDSLLAALDVACSPDGLGLSQRHVHISTVGVPAKIKRLADLGKSYHLAVSLHAPNDALRDKIVPTNAKVGLGPILDAADYFFQKTGRQVTFEYVLLGELNDRPEHARELGRLLAGRKAHVNVIPFNRVPGLPYKRPEQDALAEFLRTLRNAGVGVTVRKRKGADIDAACGQLRRAAQDNGPPAGTSAGGAGSRE
jgi:23S rRNA (adenine2503-C2)-methyltransferase